jgi:hypothetical protein
MNWIQSLDPVSYFASDTPLDSTWGDRAIRAFFSASLSHQAVDQDVSGPGHRTVNCDIVSRQELEIEQLVDRAHIDPM